ncbi:MAG: CoA activase [Desulfamplus sp.]|nr:CoA activase [Desulfamplus sp.]
MEKNISTIGNINVLGIDVGSVSVSIAGVNCGQISILCEGSRFHHGNIAQALESVLSDVDLTAFRYVAVTSSTPSIIKRSQTYDEQVSIIRAARHFHKKFGSIINVGGEKFSLSLFDQFGNYCGSKNNTSCAAGTGSFLDQQSKRLGLASPRELSEAASENSLRIPDIATRCAVFAKTDLIHAQQEGFSVPQICDGLCKGLARNIYNTLFTNETIQKPVIFCGGVSKNSSVKKHLDELTGTSLLSDGYSHLYGAIGAALCMADDLHDSIKKSSSDLDSYLGENGSTNSVNSKIPPMNLTSFSDLLMEKEKKQKFFYPELTLTLSDYPDFKSFKSEISDGVEIDIYENPATVDYNFAYISRSNSYTSVSRSDLSVHSSLNAASRSIRDTHNRHHCYLGLDVGSTSTKGVIITEKGTVMAGFYTRTASRPVQAVQSILKSVDEFISGYNLDIKIIGCGTTGSGRKLSAGIIGADLVLDEITAHSRAAYELNSQVDTIIEIGGQDAKFTTMKNGVVTSSFMNTVCAAGTGSFIEEQALKLGCPLFEYSSRTESVKSPISSDRCTVFMERDMNHFLSEGYSVNEVLASALHSVRDNYITKVATEAKIGDTILFQGATAKNRALVAAFEQRLKKPIHVSKYCHLTGALGVALTLKDMHTQVAFSINNEQTAVTNSDEQAIITTIDEHQQSRFRGFDLWKREIPVRQETCQLCTNNCKLTIVEMGDETVAFGFLCGRDYGTEHYVAKEQNFHLLRSRKKAVTLPHPCKIQHQFSIGIPAALHIVEDLDFWKIFFNYLGIKTISSERMKSPVTRGRSLANAEFCTPVTSVHGHVDYLMEKADYVFLPYYFENKNREKSGRRQYCYYTQYVPSVIAALPNIKKERLISPVIKDLYTNFYTKIEIYRALKKISDSSFSLSDDSNLKLQEESNKTIFNGSGFSFFDDSNISFFDISSAYDKAMEWKKGAEIQLKELYIEETDKSDDINVLLIGRPYTILSESLNSKIPDIFASLNIKIFFQDMLDFEHHNFSEIEPLLKEIHWEHTATILKATLIAAKTENLFPVYITSFKCAPDSFGVDYFKKIMEAYEKPYLVLELDEHDSSVGYETRIEAAVRAFKNFSQHGKIKSRVNLDHINPQLETTLPSKTEISDSTVSLSNKTMQSPMTILSGRTAQSDMPELSGRREFSSKTALSDKTIVMPNWDYITCSFLAATLRGEGYDTILMEETDDTIKQSLKTNTGQCIPLNAIASGYIQTIINRNLNPENCLLWMSKSEISCNIKLYPHHIKSILSGIGKNSDQSKRVEFDFNAQKQNNEQNPQKETNGANNPLIAGIEKLKIHNLEKAGVYKGELTFSEISVRASLNAYFAYMFGGLLRALGCRIRPYEKIKGETDQAIKQAVRILNMAFEGRTTREDSLQIALAQFETIETFPRDNRPKVGIFGDFYVRDNDVMNQNLIHFIEEHGGEVITTPYYRFAKMIAESYFKKWFKEGRYFSLIANKAILTTMTQLEKRYYRFFEPFFNEPDHVYNDDFTSVLANYGLLPEHTGESMDNILKIHYTVKENPDIALFIQTTPSFCCPGLVTEAMSAKIERVTGVPVVSITYDALGGNKNRVIIPFLQYRKENAIALRSTNQIPLRATM